MPDESSPNVRLERLRRYTSLLDDGIRIPGTRIRFGLDPILGLVPGVGDLAGAVLSSAIMFEAVRLGVSRATLVRMVLNIAADTGFGSVPVMGDLFDAVWKANRKNLALLEAHVGMRVPGRPVSVVAVALAVVALFLVCLGVAFGLAMLVTLLL